MKSIKLRCSGRHLLNLLSRVKRFSVEHTITREIDRSSNSNTKIGFLLVDIKGATGGEIYKLIPGVPLSMEWSDLELNPSDYRISGLFRYAMMLPRTNEEGVESLKCRIMSLGQELGCTEIKIGSALYPQDGENARTLLEIARLNMQNQ